MTQAYLAKQAFLQVIGSRVWGYTRPDPEEPRLSVGAFLLFVHITLNHSRWSQGQAT